MSAADSLELFGSLGSLEVGLVALHLLQDDYASALWNIQAQATSPLATCSITFVSDHTKDIASGYARNVDDRHP